MLMLKRVALALLAVYLIFVGAIFWVMHQPPARIAAVFGKLPGPMFMLFPFETMWFNARAGALHPGDTAPDFRLPALDKQSEVTLSSFRGVRPVVLVFGSYT